MFFIYLFINFLSILKYDFSFMYPRFWHCKKKSNHIDRNKFKINIM